MGGLKFTQIKHPSQRAWSCYIVSSSIIPKFISQIIAWSD